ncbi:MAG: hypothetical protein Q9160_008364 [Pyrenula sp. 1 TL-2023]
MPTGNICHIKTALRIFFWNKEKLMQTRQLFDYLLNHPLISQGFLRRDTMVNGNNGISVRLSEDVIIEILSHLPPFAVDNYSCVSRQFYRDIHYLFVLRKIYLQLVPNYYINNAHWNDLAAYVRALAFQGTLNGEFSPCPSCHTLQPFNLFKHPYVFLSDPSWRQFPCFPCLAKIRWAQGRPDSKDDQFSTFVENGQLASRWDCSVNRYAGDDGFYRHFQLRRDMAHFRAHPEAVGGSEKREAFSTNREVEELSIWVEALKRLRSADKDLVQLGYRKEMTYDFWFFCEHCHLVKVRRGLTEKDRDALDEESTCLACSRGQQL